MKKVLAWTAALTVAAVLIACADPRDPCEINPTSIDRFGNCVEADGEPCDSDPCDSDDLGWDSKKTKKRHR